MSGVKDVFKGGWHPKDKGGDRETWRGQFKGVDQVAGWMGKGKKDSASTASAERVSRPLTTLKDPSLFGPPPKNVNYHGGAALPDEITPHTGGIGAPLRPSEIDEARTVLQRETQPEPEGKRAPPPTPFRADRTGLRTDILPPPPIHRPIQMADNTTGSSKAAPKPKPSLPPRLPSRQSTGVTPVELPANASPPAYETAAPEQPKQSTHLNQNAINRLGRAGVSVPGFGIGTATADNANESNPWKTEKSQSKSTQPPQLSELQTRFARMNSPSNTSTTNEDTTPTTGGGTTWSQKQSALQTASSFHKDPTSISLSDAQSAASTANNFHQRHGDQIAAGASKANAWNKKYNIAGKVSEGAGRFSGYLEKQASPVNESPSTLIATTPVSPVDGAGGAASINRKPPPPPPPKKPAGMHAPPPVPLGTKPTF